VRKERLELSRLAALEPKSSASTNSATFALIVSSFGGNYNIREPLKNQISSQLLRCGKNFFLTYTSYAALRNFFRALHLGEL
jgi:hypothetical protein